MPRKRRSFLDYSCYHITHRCHDREFMFKFQKDRDKYFEFLREANKRFRISILDYMITSNHIHILVWAGKGEQISKAMQFVQGSFGQYYNKKHGRQGAFWRDRYHPTRIQSGEHLGRCLFYIDLNSACTEFINYLPRNTLQIIKIFNLCKKINLSTIKN